MRTLIVQNSAASAAGYLGDFLTNRCGAELTVVRPDVLDEDGWRGFDLLVCLGSPCGADDDLEWIHRERRVAAAAIAHGMPAIGICFGAQLIAAALGGSATPLPRRYHGWYANDGAHSDVWHGPWLRWHGDHVVPPPGAHVHASSAGIVQGFSAGRAAGVQFHPEADLTTLDNWLELASPNLRSQLDVAALRAESQRHFAGDAAKREALFTELLELTGCKR